MLEGEANTLAQKVLSAHSDVMWRDMGHHGTINALEGLKHLYRRIYAEATLERMTGKWDGKSPYFGEFFDCEPVSKNCRPIKLSGRTAYVETKVDLPYIDSNHQSRDAELCPKCLKELSSGGK